MSYNLLKSHTIIGKKLDLFHDYSLFVLVFISSLVFSLLLIFWFNSWVFDNFVESKVTEFLWTSFPGLVLLFLVVPSIHGLYNLDYMRLSRVKMNAMVSGRQWYWSFKFLPRVHNNSVCDSCQRYFDFAEKTHYWFNSSANMNNSLLPYWAEGLKKKLGNVKEYWMGPLGVLDGLHVPKSIVNLISDPNFDNKVNYLSGLNSDSNSNAGRVIRFHPSMCFPKVSKSEFDNLYSSTLFEGFTPLVRKMKFYFNVDSYMLSGKIGYMRNLDTHIPLVLPARKLVRFFFWSSDVIHSFAVPELSVKLDCVPGRLKSSFVFIRHMGKYFGQCSEICGVNHSFMPVSIEAYYYHLKGEKKFCYGKHYDTDYDNYWNSTVYFRTTFFRLWGLMGYVMLKISAVFGLAYNVNYEEVLPTVLCPGCVWIRDFLVSCWTGKPMGNRSLNKYSFDSAKV